MSGIIICGGNGSGKTTLGRELAKELQYKHMDIEAYYFLDAPIPYSKSRSREEVCDLILQDIKKYNNFIISAVNGNFGDEINLKYTLAVFLDAPLELRLKRIKQRAYDKFGSRVLEGGDMYEQEQRFFEVVEKHWGEKIEKTKVWLKTLSCPVIYLDGTKPSEKNIEYLIKKYGYIFGGENG